MSRDHCVTQIRKGSAPTAAFPVRTQQARSPVGPTSRIQLANSHHQNLRERDTHTDLVRTSKARDCVQRRKGNLPDLRNYGRPRALWSTQLFKCSSVAHSACSQMSRRTTCSTALTYLGEPCARHTPQHADTTQTT